MGFDKEAWLACLAIAARDEGSIQQALVRLATFSRVEENDGVRWQSGEVPRTRAIAIVADALYAELYGRT